MNVNENSGIKSYPLGTSLLHYHIQKKIRDVHHNLSSPKIGQKGQEVLRQAEIKIVGNVQFSGKSPNNCL
jgi:hypothetical protein